MEFDALDVDSVIDMVIVWCVSRESRYVCVANVHQCMEVFDSEEFKQVVNNADLIVADSRVLNFFQRKMLGGQLDCVRGKEMTLLLCERAESQKIPIALYGGTEESLGRLQSELSSRFPSLDIVCAISPPFRPLTDRERQAHVEKIRASNAALVFVGIGCPKQERWMSVTKDDLPAVQIGVGVAFDFISGDKKSSPVWVHRIGFEWLYRLFTEPRRLWLRYFKHNPRFLYHVTRQLLGKTF